MGVLRTLFYADISNCGRGSVCEMAAELVMKDQFYIARKKDKCFFTENLMANCRLQLYYTQTHACTYARIYSMYVYIYIHKIYTHKPFSFSSVPESSFVGIPILDILFVNRGPGD